MRCRPKMSWSTSSSMTGREGGQNPASVRFDRNVGNCDDEEHVLLLLPFRNATNRLEKLVQELDKEVRTRSGGPPSGSSG